MKYKTGCSWSKFVPSCCRIHDVVCNLYETCGLFVFSGASTAKPDAKRSTSRSSFVSVTDLSSDEDMNVDNIWWCHQCWWGHGHLHLMILWALMRTWPLRASDDIISYGDAHAGYMWWCCEFCWKHEYWLHFTMSSVKTWILTSTYDAVRSDGDMNVDSFVWHSEFCWEHECWWHLTALWVLLKWTLATNYDRVLSRIKILTASDVVMIFIGDMNSDNLWHCSSVEDINADGTWWWYEFLMRTRMSETHNEATSSYEGVNVDSIWWLIRLRTFTMISDLFK